MDTVAKFLVEDLLNQNINTYFGIPGGPIITMFDAVLRTPGTTLIESKHETAAVFEAIGYYKSTGKIPVVLVSAGPGITNCLTGIASAKALRIPLLLICGDVSWEKNNCILLQTGGSEGTDIEATYAPHTEKIIRGKFPEYISQQVIDFLQTRKADAPSIIILPLFVSNSNIEKPIINPIAKVKNKKYFDYGVISVVNRKLDQANKPLLIIGNGARSSQDKLNQLVSHLGIPTITTPQAKGLVSEEHELSLGHCGLAATKWIREYLQEKPDVVLVLGSDLDDCAVGITEFIGDQTQLIHVDLNAKVFNRKYKTSLGIIADIKDFIEFLLKEDAKPSRLNLIQSLKKTNPYDVPNFRQDISEPIAPHRVLADLENSCSMPVRFVSDIGEHMLFCLHYLTSAVNSFSIDLGIGSMGSGICQSIGMCLGDKQPTIVICGDGGMQMHGMEILTAIQYNLPIIFVVFNDARYNMVYHGFKFSFGREEHLGQTNYIDFVKWAEALGATGHLIEKPDQINKELISACWASGKPTILDVRINKNIRIAGAGRVEVLKTMGEN